MLIVFLAGCYGRDENILMVTNPGDESDLNPGDARCSIGGLPYKCTLRAAIEEANAMPGEQTITFNLSTGEEMIFVNEKLPEITDDTIIDGTTQPEYDGGKPVVKINGERLGTERTLPNGFGLVVRNGKNVTVKAVQILWFDYGGISNHGNLTLDHLEIAANQGNGISSNPELDIGGTVDVAISHSAIFENGKGGLRTINTNISLNNVSISRNQGSGIWMQYGSLVMAESTIDGNTASPLSPGEAGGINLYEGSDLVITDSTIQGNDAMEGNGWAGGIFIRAETASITNSLITENNGWYSGGIYIQRGIVHLIGSTLTKNTGWDAGGVFVSEEEGSELWVEDGTRIGKPGEGNTAAIISDGDKFGGGIFAQNDVTLTDSTVEDNSGAGIHIISPAAGGSLQIARSSIQNNTLAGIAAVNANVTISEGTIRNNMNGGISVQNGLLILNGSVVSDNENGGGIFINGGMLGITGSTVSGNRNLGMGGGGAGENLLRVDIGSSTISGNSTAASGGGLLLSGSTGPVKIYNSTISGNRSGDFGGGLVTAGGSINLNNVTLTRNMARTVGGIINGSALTISNSILAENSGGNCGAFTPITSGGHNLDDGTSCGFSSTGDLSGVPANLSPLQDNGGGTFTHALLSGSPALEAGNDATCKTTDQRGISRPQGLHCDMGAYEAENPATATPPTITSTLTPTLAPTWTPTRTPAAILFDPIFSTDVIYASGRSCDPKEMTVQVKVAPAEQVASLGLFHRLEEKNGTNVGPWMGGLSMDPQGSGWYRLTLYGENLIGDFQSQDEIWVAFQFVANGKDGQVLTRSPVFRKVTLGRCYQ